MIFVYFNWPSMLTCSVFFIKFLLRILFANCGPGCNLKWWWNNVHLQRDFTIDMPEDGLGTGRNM